MSRITELISKMYAFLDSADQSSTPEMRELSCRFASLCREVNADLEQADALLKKGLVIDALKFDKDRHPSLLSRAAILNIKRYDEWCAVCRLYGNWETPPPIRLDIVRRMHDAYRSTELLAPLLEKWRAIMRDGSTGEKLEILREIHKLDPGNKAWAGNLAKLEQVRLEELYDEAKQAILAGDCVGLEKIFLELSSPELNTQPDPRVIRKITSVLHDYQKKQLASQTRRLLGEIAEAYSEQDYETLQHLFQTWEGLESDPDFELPPGADAQISDTRAWMRQVREERERQEQFDRTLSALVEQLDSEGPIHEIERLYGTLQRLDLPLPEFLMERVRDAREKADLKSARIHRRRLVFGVLTIAAVIGITAFLIARMQEEKTYQDLRRQMEAALREKQYQTVLDQYNRVSVSGSALANRPALLKLRDDAEEGLRQRKTLANEYESALKSAEPFLTAEGVEDKRLEQQIRIAESLRRRIPLTPKQSAALDRIKLRREELLQKGIREREIRYRKEMTRLETGLADLRKRAVLTADLVKLSGELAERRGELERILQSECARGISASYRDLFRKRLEFSLNALSDTLKKLQAEKEYRKRLNSPVSFLDYMSALESLETRQPDLLASYAEAVAMTLSWRRFSDGIFSRKDLNDPRTLKTIYQSAAAETGINPNYRDLEAFVPREIENASEQNPCPALTTQLETLGTTLLSKEYDLYEVILADSAGNRYHFFCDRAPEFEQPRKNSKYPHSMTLMVSTRPGSVSPLKLEISGMYGKVFFRRTGELKGVLLPDSFETLVNSDLISRTFPKAHHYTFLKSACRTIRNASTPAEAEEAVLTALRNLKRTNTMNSCMRLIAAKRLLSMLKLTSGLNDGAVDRALAPLNAAEIPEWSWMNPREEVDHASEAAAMRSAVDRLNLEELESTIRFHRSFYETALSRILHPAAVVLLDGGKERIVPFRDTALSDELWSLTRQPDGGFRIRIHADRDPKTGLFRKRPSAAGTFHGMVLFTPDDRENTAALLDRLLRTSSLPGQSMPQTVYPVRWPENARETP